MTFSALLIGGPNDGQVVHVQPPQHTVNAPKPAAPGLDPETGVLWGEHLEYHLTDVSVFGVSIKVYVLKDWPTERMEATLSRLLLSPLALRLADQ